MAKFTKLNIGDSVASSGGRVWKKLSVESAEDTGIIGTWQFNSSIATLPSRGTYYSPLGEISADGHTIVLADDTTHHITIRVDSSRSWNNSSTFLDTLFFMSSAGTWSYPRIYYALGEGWKYLEKSSGTVVACSPPIIKITGYIGSMGKSEEEFTELLKQIATKVS